MNPLDVAHVPVASEVAKSAEIAARGAAEIRKRTIYSDANPWGKTLLDGAGETKPRMGDILERELKKQGVGVTTQEGTTEFRRRFGNVLQYYLDKAEKHRLFLERVPAESRETVELLDKSFDERFNMFLPNRICDFIKVIKLTPLGIQIFISKARRILPEGLTEAEIMERELPKDWLKSFYETTLVKFVVGSSNCYAYSMGLVTGKHGEIMERPGMGQISGRLNEFRSNSELLITIRDQDPSKFRRLVEGYWRQDCDALGCDLLSKIDGREITQDYVPKEGERMIALMRGYSEDGADFHFALKEKDGTWTHKQGLLAPTRYDCSGKLITDLEKADIRAGDMFKYDVVGYYVVKPRLV